MRRTGGRRLLRQAAGALRRTGAAAGRTHSPWAPRMSRLGRAGFLGLGLLESGSDVSRQGHSCVESPHGAAFFPGFRWGLTQILLLHRSFGARSHRQCTTWPPAPPKAPGPSPPPSPSLAPPPSPSLGCRAVSHRLDRHYTRLPHQRHGSPERPPLRCRLHQAAALCRRAA